MLGFTKRIQGSVEKAKGGLAPSVSVFTADPGWPMVLCCLTEKGQRETPSLLTWVLWEKGLFAEAAQGRAGPFEVCGLLGKAKAEDVFSPASVIER
jgi:hypothetical protein